MTKFNSSALMTTWKVYYIVICVSLCTPKTCWSLTLSAGQRIPSKFRSSTCGSSTLSPEHQQQVSRTKDFIDMQKYSIFDLPRVEQWATKQGLQEHHLKKIYHVVMRQQYKNDNYHDANDDDDEGALFFTNLDLELKRGLEQIDFPRKQAEALVRDFAVCTSRVVETRSSSSGGKKIVVKLQGGLLVETVLIRHNRQNGNKNKNSSRYTVCVSSQVGCAKACSFCGTGTMGLLANLSSAQILEQVWLARNVVLLGEESPKLRNVVFMAMGEPLDNYDAVHEACRGLTHQCLFGFKGKHVTISTVGDSPRRIRQLAEEAPQISLALSLHGATQDLRTKLIVSAKRAPLEKLEEALDYHATETGRGAMLEYLLIDGVNDSDQDANALVEFCLRRRRRACSNVRTGSNSDSAVAGDQCEHPTKQASPVFVNLIPYNPTAAGDNVGYQTPPDERILAFHNRLRGQGVNSLIRWTSTSGRDADGACGQLVLNTRKSP